MTKKELFSKIDNEKKLELWNEWCEEGNNYDDEVFINDDEFLETFYNNNLVALAKAISYGEYQYNHEYVKFTVYGLKSYTSICAVLEDISIEDEFIDFAIKRA